MRTEDEIIIRNLQVINETLKAGLSLVSEVEIKNDSGSSIPVDDGGGSITVDGTITANAGTNLNTSLLALDSTVAKDNSLTTINTSINTLLKPASTLTKVTTVDTITNVVHIDDNSGSITVDGVFYQATQPVSIASTIATSEASPTTVYNGKTTVATAGTRAILGASTTIKSVTIKALRNNTNILYVGNSTVSNLNGLQLSAGESVSLDIDNLNKIYIDVDTSEEGCTWLAIN